MDIPKVVTTPGTIEGAQFDFQELFIKRLKQEVCVAIVPKFSLYLAGVAHFLD